MNNLSRRASETVKDLEKQIEQVISADRVREPKLTEDERKEVIELEAVVKLYAPRMVDLNDKIVSAEARLKEVRCHYYDWIFDGKETPDSVTKELVNLPVFINVLYDTFKVAMSFHNDAMSRINKIKDLAREREAANA
ncbi:MAG: hypothetical protein AAGU75_16150 [Bacillota bacterium]